MHIQVTKEAAKWYRDELDIQESANLRLYVRYGFGGNIPGFSLGINNEVPDDVHTTCKVENITFFIKTKDEWYFDDKDLHIHLNTEMDEPQFKYV